MTGGDPDEDGTQSSDESGAPVDFDRLTAIGDRLTGDSRFTRVVAEPAVAPEQIRCVYRRFKASASGLDPEGEADTKI